MKVFIQLLCIFAVIALPIFLSAQLPNVGMVANINPNTGSGSPGNMTKLGSNIIFRANNGTTGNEIWKTDGTSAGTVLVKDINSGSTSSNPNNFVLMGSYVYFTANDGVNGGALWRTDGTAAGTTLVKDINTGSTTSNAFITHLVAIGSSLYFRGDDGVNGIEPWISNGTTAGTVMLKNIAPGATGSTETGGSYEFVEFNGYVYFSANDHSNAQNYELWRTDGTTAGTVLFRDFYGFGGGYPNNLVMQGHTCFLQLIINH